MYMVEEGDCWALVLKNLITGLGRKWMLLPEQHGVHCPDVQRQRRSQEEGQMTNTDIPARGERKG